MRATLAGLLMLLTLAAADAQRMVVIGNDPGGLIAAYLHRYDALRQARTFVVLAGDCMSACTLVLRLPRSQVCARPGARLGFHGASFRAYGRFELGDRAMEDAFARLYPNPRMVRPFLNSLSIHYIPASRFFPVCRV